MPTLRCKVVLFIVSRPVAQAKRGGPGLFQPLCGRPHAKHLTREKLQRCLNDHDRLVIFLPKSPSGLVLLHHPSAPRTPKRFPCRSQGYEFFVGPIVLQLASHGAYVRLELDRPPCPPPVRGS